VATVIESGSLMGNAGAALFQDSSLYPLAVASGEWWRLVTTGFLHFGPLHLLFNMWALWVMGKDLEMAMGRARFLTIYLVSLLGGSTAAFLLAGLRSDTAGASGAVFGLMGGLAVVLLRLRQSPRPVLTLIAVNIALSIVIPGISLVGHIGGMITGAAVTAVIVYAPRERQTMWQAGGVAGIVLLLLVIMAARATAITAGAMTSLLG
jgi:membrane associated rhomboid family serine protease